MTIVKIAFAPGIKREGTQYSEEGSWYDCDKVRFRGRYPEKLGGWTRYTDGGIKGVVRNLHNWTLLDSKNCLALGTNKKIYIEQGGRLNNITPIRFTDTNTNPITTEVSGDDTLQTYTTSAAHGAFVGDTVILSDVANVDGICTSTGTDIITTGPPGSNQLTISGFTHYAEVGDTVTISGASTFDGIADTEINAAHTIITTPTPESFVVQVSATATAGYTTGGGAISLEFLARLNREFVIVSVPTSTTFVFQTQTSCTTGGVTGGGAATAAFEANIGLPFNVLGTGWGTGYWSRGAWGGPSTLASTGIALRLWGIDNYGEDLVFCVRDGPLYLWDATNGFSTRGQLISGLPGASEVPTQTSIVLVTDDRHVISVGSTNRITLAFDPLLIRWSDQEDYLNWTPSITTTAGSIRIPSGSYAVAALKTRQETLIWTDVSLHSLQFSGPPYTFSLQTLDENINIVGPKAAATVNGVTYWMGINRFWVYSGRVEPLPCSVQRYVFNNFNRNQAAQTHAYINEEFSEVTWLYCDASSDTINRYVTFNYQQNIWYYGSMERTAMLVCAGRGGFPYGAQGGYTADASLYVHESGYDDGSTNPPSAIEAYLESADFSVDTGNKIIFADRIIPDVTFDRSVIDAPQMNIWVRAKKFPGSPVQDTDIREIQKDGGSALFSVLTEATRQVWARLRGREMRIRYETTEAGVCWLVGDLRMNIRQDGVQ